MVRTVERAFELLEIIADAGGEIGVSELAAITDLPTSSIHRLLRTCQISGFVRQLRFHRYALGPSLIKLGDCAGQQLAWVARPRLRELAGRLGETASMAVLDGNQVVYVAQHVSSHAMRMVTDVGTRASLHATAAGKAMLATLSVAEVRAIVNRTGLETTTGRTLVTLDGLLDDLAATRSRGFAVDDEEQEIGARGFAVAVTVPENATHMAISVSAPLGRIDPEFELRAVQELREAATQIAADLTPQRRSASEEKTTT